MNRYGPGELGRFVFDPRKFPSDQVGLQFSADFGHFQLGFQDLHVPPQGVPFDRQHVDLIRNSQVKKLQRLSDPAFPPSRAP